MSKIVLDNVRKSYGGNIEVIKGVSLEIADGEFVVLVGPSGCGKSTLLRMIAGLESITSGTISIGERVVNNVEPAERDIAMVFQNYALYPHMTVRENLAYGLKNRKTPKEEIERRIAKAAKALEIEQFLERKPRQLSGGQRQRVAMGRAIVREPAAFLFDEPLSNLDAKLRVQMRVEIKRLQRSLGTTSVYVTHDQMEAMTMADRLVVLNAGHIEQVGTPIELYEKPASTFVATFIGSPSMNLLQSPESAAWQPGSAITLPSGGCTFGVRPEDIRILEEGDQDADGFNAQVRIEAVELVGAESYIHAALSDGKPLIFRVAGRSTHNIDEMVRVGASATDVHIFGADGRRVSD
ncbi:MULTISPECIES: sn-glycerol-3-phosphate import ATP-binding protein UgpC [unclassified Brucella]|uniref:sn-glycerol-3-phosphate import ATP-binding protein UgpC n=1 Tax=unclassified Brucella TaxID=2632610 RepID=UPI000972DF07|nr:MULTISPECIES: sn-glycerol-3-phosphate import ATP-binding protein UgpC [unclassified Brucella]APY15856.1 sn-glycerol-3-phosphate ABC transporter ATP-binding protein UgpC [Brucella sp. 09RB8910]MRN44671.1 sn-glycerol-3-phosphate ABC transporter ATP-binding protein UgpC [Brucella sp. 09RB8913]MRN48048.1 sn-glycerol-3-phosphate ABC transporter ATP-binding protein UgpC [Brucella sp. 10RB9212]MRN50722.1 sn-glycerol-3-phosphate ABC transporter ATP-binding protein UgpC [Brucella sp. 10RB9214]MRN574